MCVCRRLLVVFSRSAPNLKAESAPMRTYAVAATSRQFDRSISHTSHRLTTVLCVRVKLAMAGLRKTVFLQIQVRARPRVCAVCVCTVCNVLCVC